MGYDEVGIIGIGIVAFILAYLGKNNKNAYFELLFTSLCFAVFVPILLGFNNQVMAVQNNTDASNNLDITTISNVNQFGFNVIAAVGIPAFLLLLVLGLYFDLFTAPLNQVGAKIRHKWEDGWKK